MVANMNLS